MPSNQKRPLDRLIRALGEDDQLSESPKLDTSRIVLVTSLDDLSTAHGATGFGRMWTVPVPSVGGATFAGFEFTPDEGLWVRELVAGANSRIYCDYAGGVSGGVVFGVPDNLANVPSLTGRPEDTDFPAFITASWLTLTTGSPTVPRVFRNAQVGQSLTNPQTGVFIGANQTLRDFWVPAGATFSVLAIAVNVGNTCTLQLDLPAENFFT